MAISAQDGGALNLPPELLRYIRNLNEPIEKYSPYFDALLIRRRHHEAFFQDLKDFRCQEHIAALLSGNQVPPSTSAQEEQDLDLKQIYRECSNLFLESRFAHPWCRTTPSKEGWMKAEWGSIKKQSDGKHKEEERLHKLLVPIWCGFRVRMTPTQEQLSKFLIKEEERRKRIPIQMEESQTKNEAVNRWLDTSVGHEDQTVSSGGEVLNRDSGKQRRQTIGEAPVRFDAEAYVMEDDERAYQEVNDRNQGNEGAAAAAKLFVGVAATSFLASNPRARKYLMKKLKTKKT